MRVALWKTRSFNGLELKSLAVSQLSELPN